jgi:alkanesulfonate monooxygenase SsuD/methylene tetrahydromethanopterin reductase-like flavin-dependent oxidoreductase (luciferase family)
MRIGLFLAYWPWFSPEEQIALAKQADEQGLDSVWVSEAWGQDAVSVLAWLGANTERIGLGSGLLQIPARTPAMTAMTAMTLDTLSGGRFRLGPGVSGPQVSEGWHGVSFARPLARTREYVEIVRKALAREGPLEYEGSEFRLPVEGTGMGKPLKLLGHPPRADIPDLPRRDRAEGDRADPGDRRWLDSLLLQRGARRALPGHRDRRGTRRAGVR